MFLFQVYAPVKSKGDEEGDSSSVGIRVRAKKKGEFRLPEAAPPMFLLEGMFKEREVADFISTLTPGVQNAIYASSFAWGYENASRCIKDAMKVGEVKNASDTDDRSRAFLDSMKQQSASGASGKSREVSNFVWSYYNEGLKESQAESAKSESVSEKSAFEQHEGMQVPLTAQDAVALSLSGGIHSPSILYCAAAQQAIEEERKRQEGEIKRGELIRLMHSEEKRAEESKILERKPAEAKAAEEAEELALQRREEIVREYARAERELREAIRVLDGFSGPAKARLRRIAAMLPSGLARALLENEKGFSRRNALRAQLLKWIAFSRKGKKSLLSMPSSRLLKLVSLSSILRLGK